MAVTTPAMARRERTLDRFPVSGVLSGVFILPCDYDVNNGLQKGFGYGKKAISGRG
jgi:hypothetical protein